MWQLWTVAFFHLAAFQGVEHDSKEGSNGTLQEFQDGLTQNKTVLENETNTPWRSTWVVSTTAPLLTVKSGTDYKATPTDPPITSKYLSGSFYAKYIVPPLVVLVILLVLFLMYRRKRGREIHSSMDYINESSDSDNEVGPSVEPTAEVSFLSEGIKSLPQDNTSIAEVAFNNQEKACDEPKQLPTQA